LFRSKDEAVRFLLPLEFKLLKLEGKKEEEREETEEEEEEEEKEGKDGIRG